MPTVPKDPVTAMPLTAVPEIPISNVPATTANVPVLPQPIIPDRVMPKPKLVKEPSAKNPTNLPTQKWVDTCLATVRGQRTNAPGTTVDGIVDYVLKSPEMAVLDNASAQDIADMQRHISEIAKAQLNVVFTREDGGKTHQIALAHLQATKESMKKIYTDTVVDTVATLVQQQVTPVLAMTYMQANQWRMR